MSRSGRHLGDNRSVESLGSDPILTGGFGSHDLAEERQQLGKEGHLEGDTAALTGSQADQIRKLLEHAVREGQSGYGLDSHGGNWRIAFDAMPFNDLKARFIETCG